MSRIIFMFGLIMFQGAYLYTVSSVPSELRAAHMAGFILGVLTWGVFELVVYRSGERT
jgi:hypothetical protein